MVLLPVRTSVVLCVGLLVVCELLGCLAISGEHLFFNFFGVVVKDDGEIFLQKDLLLSGEGDAVEFINFGEAGFGFFGVDGIEGINIVMHEHTVGFDFHVLIDVEEIVPLPTV